MVDVKTDAVKELLGKRGLKEADVVDVVKSAEAARKKAVNKATNRSIGKKVINNVTIYADYGMEKGILKSHANVTSAYSHRMTLGKVLNMKEDTEWTCEQDGVPCKAGTVEMTYMNVTRAGPAIVCPKCQDSWVEEYLATKTLAAAEGLFEKKKA